MKKRFSLLLAGAMILSILLSGCASQAEGPTPTNSPKDVSSQSGEEMPTGIKSEDIQVNTPPMEPGEKPLQTEESTNMLTAASKEPEESILSSTPAVVSPPSPPAPAVSTPAPAGSESAVDVPPASAVPEPAAEPTPEPVPEPIPASAATKADASAFIGQSVSSLIAAIGQPLSQSYAPSCLGGGEDGELVYNDFTVYTYREGGVETVQDVM